MFFIFGKKKKPEKAKPAPRPKAGKPSGPDGTTPKGGEDPTATVLGLGTADLGPASVPITGTTQTSFDPTRTLAGEPAIFIPEGIACGLISHTKGQRDLSPLPDYVHNLDGKDVAGVLLHLAPETTYAFGRDRQIQPVRMAGNKRGDGVYLKAETRGKSNLPSRAQFGCTRVRSGDQESVFVQHLPKGATASTFLAFLHPGYPPPENPERPWHEPLLEGFNQTRELLPGTRMFLGIYVGGKPRLIPGPNYTMVYLEGVVDAGGNILEEGEQAPAATAPDVAAAGPSGAEQPAPAGAGVDLRATRPGAEEPEEGAREEAPSYDPILLVADAACRSNVILWRGERVLQPDEMPPEKPGEAAHAGYRISAEHLSERKGDFALLIGSADTEMKERFSEFRMGDHYPDMLVLAGETSVAGSHALLSLERDGGLALRNIGQGRILIQTPADDNAREMGYQPEPLPSGSLFVIGENLAYRFYVTRE